MKRILLTALLGGVLSLAATGVARTAEAISLAGEWQFALAGTNTDHCPAEFPQKIRLPGTMDDAGLGPKNTQAPTLEGPYRLYNYAGPAWYQRDIEIPASWQGQRVTLSLERCRWVTTAWLDGQRMGSQDSLISPHVYDFGTKLAPGKHRLTLCVDNTVKLNLGRFVSTLFGGTWGNMNGIVGHLELAATPPVWIDEVQVYPELDQKRARVVIKIGNATGQPGQGMVKVNGQAVTAEWTETGGTVELAANMSHAKLWDEFSPNLTEVTVQLGDDRRTVRFGMRQLAVHGTQFTMNDRPLFLRGTLECSIFPLTGYPPTDTAAWRRIFRIEKSYGLNFIRFHSWCPPEAAFAAADEAGILIQVEGPQANVPAGSNRDRDAFIEAEFQRMVDTYGNHPSFCLMTIGNEYGGNRALLTRWVDQLRQHDSRHLYSSASGVGREQERTPNRQWTENASGRGIHGPGTLSDLSQAVASDGHPIVGHEIGQWMYWPDFREIKKWDGVMALKNYEMIRADLDKKHLLNQEADFIQASGKFATLLYKEEIEQLLRTPGYGGFSLLDLHDYPTQGTALVGPLDAFWDSKGFITPAAYRQFCNATVPLLRMPKRTYTSEETFTATAEVAHYGAADLPDVAPVWSIHDEAGHTVAAGKLTELTVPTGTVTPLGSINVALGDVHAPAKLTVTVALPGTAFRNNWEIWVYPAKSTAPTPPADVVTSASWEETKAALARGKKVVFFPPASHRPLTMAGKFLPVFWSPVWFPTQKPNTMGLLCNPQHPLFAQFPTEPYSNWQWYELMQHSRLFILDEAPADYRPLVQVVDNFARNHRLGVIFETRVGPGRLLVSGFDLPHLTAVIPAQQLLDSLYAYAGSDQFKPASELSGELLDKLFSSHP